MSDKPTVLVAESISEHGIAALREKCDVTIADGWTRENLMQKLGQYDGLVVRSATKVTADMLAAGARLKVVGRAGVGVDNVDLDAASKRGIVVVNAPVSNVLSVAEHCIGLMLALCRNIARGDRTLRAGEWQRSKLAGVEVSGRNLVLLGMGRIGQLVAERARALEMNIYGYDPFVPRERFQRLGVEQIATIEEALTLADILSLHMPLTPDTRGMIGAKQLESMRPGALIINTARGPLIDLEALDNALNAGHLGGAALDVFPNEPPDLSLPIFTRDNVLVTPHLAASTKEAQERAGEQVAQQVTAALCGGVVTSAVNVPAIGPEDLEALQSWMPLASRLARLADQLTVGAVHKLSVQSRGEIAAFDVRMLSTGALVGLLAGSTEDAVNVVNAPHLAEQRGLEVTASTDDAVRTYHSLIAIEVTTDQSEAAVAGTTIGGRPWLTEVLGFPIDIELTKYMSFFCYEDVPGVIGRVGSAFGEAGVNIANMAVARVNGTALMAVSFDEKPPLDVIEQLRVHDDFALACVTDLV